MRTLGLTSRFFRFGILFTLLLAAAGAGFRQGYAEPAGQLGPEMVEAPVCASGGGQSSTGSFGLPYTQRVRTPRPDRRTLPVYPGCADIPEYEQRIICSFRELNEFIRHHQQDPAGSSPEVLTVNGTVLASGKLVNARVRQEADPRNREEALRVVRLLQERDIRWTPGTVEGRPADMPLQLTFRFHAAVCSH